MDQSVLMFLLFAFLILGGIFGILLQFNSSVSRIYWLWRIFSKDRSDKGSPQEGKEEGQDES